MVAWPVIEMDAAPLPSVPRRTLREFLLAPHKQNNGAELYSLLLWLTNLSPLAPSPVFYFDSQWVIDIWSGVLPLRHGTPFLDICERVLLQKSETA